MTDDKERRSMLEGRISGNPRLQDAIAQRIAEGRLPPALARAAPQLGGGDGGDGKSPLESLAVLPFGALEAIVRLTGRPPMLIRNDEVELEPLPDFPPDIDGKILTASKWIPSVGRIEFINASMSWGGTGSVVAKRGDDVLVMTNRHVAKIVARRASDGSGLFVRNQSGVRCAAQVDFREEEGSIAGDATRTVGVRSIEYLADDLAADVALLRVAPGAFTLPHPLDLADDEAGLDEHVALIGYPAYDSRNDADAQAAYFRDLYDVKRFAPGKVIQELGAGSMFTYDCTSLGGNSGSPVISLDSGKLVGLHFSGLYGVENRGVGITTIKQLLSGAFPLVQVPESIQNQEARGDGVHQASAFVGRKGFDTGFLGKTFGTPWPKITPALADGLAEPSDKPKEPGELRYTHFGVKYSGTLKIPLMTAVNIDGKQSVRIKRSDDQWFSDLRIPAAVQLGKDNFADVRIDRGHMVRREDPNWGSQKIAERANFDTFHYVNAAAQHALLNQGKAQWQGLENYILDSTRTGGMKACVFTGPVIGEEDETIDGARVPLEFWKLVATLNEDNKALRATAYILSQGQMIRELLEKRSRVKGLEGIVLGEYRTFQITIVDLADATGYDFSAYLSADPLRRTEEGAEVADETEPRFIPLETLADIVLEPRAPD